MNQLNTRFPESSVPTEFHSEPMRAPTQRRRKRKRRVTPDMLRDLERRAEAWKANHYTGQAYRCGDSWGKIDISCSPFPERLAVSLPTAQACPGGKSPAGAGLVNVDDVAGVRVGR